MALGKLRQGVSIPRMKPAAAEIEGEAVAEEAMGASAEAVGPLEQDERSPGRSEPTRGRNARCPAADDRDVETSVCQGLSAQ